MDHQRVNPSDATCLFIPPENTKTLTFSDAFRGKFSGMKFNGMKWVKFLSVLFSVFWAIVSALLLM